MVIYNIDMSPYLKSQRPSNLYHVVYDIRLLLDSSETLPILTTDVIAMYCG